MNNSKTIVAWVSLSIGLLSWGGVYWLTLLVQQSGDTLLHNIHASRVRSGDTSDVQRIHAVFTTTAQDREKLDTWLNTDPLAVSQEVTHSAQAQGVSITLSSASVTDLPSKTNKLQTIEFIASSGGSYADVIRVLAVLEQLPFITTVDAVDISLQPQTGISKNPPHIWSIRAHVKIIIRTHTS